MKTLDDVIEALKAGAVVTIDMQFSEVAAPDVFIHVGDESVSESSNPDLYNELYRLTFNIEDNEDPQPDARLNIDVQDHSWHKVWTITLAEL